MAFIEYSLRKITFRIRRHHVEPGGIVNEFFHEPY
jgi:hypothetical protein